MNLPQSTRDVYLFLQQNLYGQGEREAAAVARALLEDGLGLSYARSTERFPEKHWPRLLQMLEEVLQGRPVAYVCGKTWFYHLPIHCDERVLIPRPETEELVHHILEDHPPERFPALQVLDIGSGSGCIALALKKQRPNWRVRGIDLSEDALCLARENAQALQLDVSFDWADVLRPETLDAKSTFDLVISNPPYISPDEANQMDASVIKYEPHLALFAPREDPLVFYRTILAFAERQLKKGGRLYLELNAFRAEEVKKLFSPCWQQEIRLDMQGKKRFLLAQFTG